MQNPFVLPEMKLRIKLPTASLLMSTLAAKRTTSFWHPDLLNLLLLPLWTWAFTSCFLLGRHRFPVQSLSLPTLGNTMLRWMTISTWIKFPQVPVYLIMLVIIKRRINKNMTIIPSMLIFTFLWRWLAFTTTILEWCTITFFEVFLQCLKLVVWSITCFWSFGTHLGGCFNIHFSISQS